MKRTMLALLLLTGCPLGQSESTPATVVSVSDMTPASSQVLPVLDVRNPGAEPTVTLMPGIGIGPIRLGMSKKDIEALGLPIGDAYAGLQVGPYRVLLDADVVTLVEVELAELPDGMLVGGNAVPATERDIERIASYLSGCGKLEMLIGGNVIECAGGVRVQAGGPPGIVSLVVSAR